MAKRKNTHPDWKLDKQRNVNSRADSSNKNLKATPLIRRSKRLINWKKFAIQIGIPGLILTLFASFILWTVQSIYDIKNDLACVSTELACYEEFVSMKYSIGLEVPFQSDNEDASN